VTTNSESVVHALLDLMLGVKEYHLLTTSFKNLFGGPRNREDELQQRRLTE
jgi:hypothetical protein